MDLKTNKEKILREFARGFIVSGLIISFALLKLCYGGNFKMCMFIHLKKKCTEMLLEEKVANNSLLWILGLGCFSYFLLRVYAFFKFSTVTIYYFIIIYYWGDNL